MITLIDFVSSPAVGGGMEASGIDPQPWRVTIRPYRRWGRHWTRVQIYLAGDCQAIVQLRTPLGASLPARLQPALLTALNLLMELLGYDCSYHLEVGIVGDQALVRVHLTHMVQQVSIPARVDA